MSLSEGMHWNYSRHTLCWRSSTGFMLERGFKRPWVVENGNSVAFGNGHKTRLQQNVQLTRCFFLRSWASCLILFRCFRQTVPPQTNPAATPLWRRWSYAVDLSSAGHPTRSCIFSTSWDTSLVVAPGSTTSTVLLCHLYCKQPYLLIQNRQLTCKANSLTTFLACSKAISPTLL